ncbi:MAG: GNAT family N-acetyltransferase [Vicinamibacteria bacterium]
MTRLSEVTGDADDLAELRRLFREYADGLGVDLGFQGFEEELASLPGDYVRPGGTLVLARVDGAPAGCVAAHPWSGTTGEMKRLFVREAFRGTGCGEALVRHVLEWARAAGYRSLVLDTLPSMQAAQRMYERLGFRERSAYRPNPVAGTRYFTIELFPPAQMAAPWLSLHLEGDVDDRALVEATAAVLGRSAGEIAITDSAPRTSQGVWCRVSRGGGQFRTSLEVFADRVPEGLDLPAFGRAMSTALGRRCLVSDDEVNPYSWTLVDRDQMRTVHVDVDALDAEEGSLVLGPHDGRVEG